MKDDKKWYSTPGLKKSISELDELLSRNSEYPILIQGPTGSGKTFFYERIKQHFKKDNPNLPHKLINCAAISENLIDAELFGHEKGAFTGATKRKIGLLQAADGGIAILDEIGELSKTLQANLLTFFDTQKIRRVGGLEDEQVNTFIVGTTNKPKEIFRDDFWHRFNKIKIPPLYERRKDILYLMRYFCGTTPIIGWQLLDCLCQTWDGNVRELNIEYHHYTKKEGLAETDELSSKLQNFSCLDFVNILEILREQISHPLFFLKYSQFNSIADRLQKKFPTLFGTNVLNLSKFNDEQLEELYREFLLFCWHFYQHPCLNDNILEHISKLEPTQSIHFYTGTLDPGCDNDLQREISNIYAQNPKSFGGDQIDQSEPQPNEHLSEREPIPINYFDIMKKVSPNDYYQLWLLYHLRKKSQKDIAKEFNISTSTISRWVKKKLPPDILKKLGSV